MNKIITHILIFLILLSFVFAGRKSSDKVPDTNSILNGYVQDVVGNKGDTTNGSVMAILVSSTNSSASSDTLQRISTNNEATIEALQRISTNNELTIETLQIISTNNEFILDALMDVPGIDYASNLQIKDVIGNKSDTHEGTSIFSLLKIIKDYFFINQNVYPTNVDPIGVTNAAPWVDGALSTIVASNGIADQFTINAISIETLSSNDIYQLTLYYGGSDTECGKVRFAKTAATGPIIVPMSTILFNSNEIIKASLASVVGATNYFVEISIVYHTH